MSKKISTGWIVYYIVLCSMVFFIIGNVMYQEVVIFPPTAPENLEELATWEEDDLWRLMEYYDCRSRPRIDVPDDLKEFVKFCDTVYDYWDRKYIEEKYDDAREGARKLRQE